MLGSAKVPPEREPLWSYIVWRDTFAHFITIAEILTTINKWCLCLCFSWLLFPDWNEHPADIKTSLMPEWRGERYNDSYVMFFRLKTGLTPLWRWLLSHLFFIGQWRFDIKCTVMDPSAWLGEPFPGLNTGVCLPSWRVRRRIVDEIWMV